MDPSFRFARFDQELHHPREIVEAVPQFGLVDEHARPDFEVEQASPFRVLAGIIGRHGEIIDQPVTRAQSVGCKITVGPEKFRQVKHRHVVGEIFLALVVFVEGRSRNSGLRCNIRDFRARDAVSRKDSQGSFEHLLLGPSAPVLLSFRQPFWALDDFCKKLVPLALCLRCFRRGLVWAQGSQF